MFVLVAAIVYGLALFVVASAGDVPRLLIGMALGGLGFGMYMAEAATASCSPSRVRAPSQERHASSPSKELADCPDASALLTVTESPRHLR